MKLATDWKKRFLDLSVAQQAQDVERRDLDVLIRQIIVRLSLVAEDQLPSLKVELATLRENLRDGIKPSVHGQIKKVSSALMDVSKGKSGQQKKSKNSASGLITRMLKRAALSNDGLEKSQQLIDMLSQQPNAAINDQTIDQVLSLLTQNIETEPDRAVAVKPEKKSSKGLFGRLLGNNSDTAVGHSDVNPNKVLLDILKTANWPDHWQSDIESYCTRLQKAPEGEEWSKVLFDLATFMVAVLNVAETEMSDTEGFLAALTEKLESIDQSLMSGADSRSAARNNNKQLNVEIIAGVSDISTRVSSSTDLKQLKADVGASLDNIKQAMDQHMVSVEERIRLDESREEKLSQRLVMLERETHELRGRTMQARHQALLDAVTGIPNRMAYDERVQQEFVRWKRFKDPLTMLVWDLDDFKQVNDRFGHQAGDKALKVIASALNSRLRESDFISRYGGEEFVVLLTGTGLDAGYDIAEGLRKAIETVGLHSGDKHVIVTLSCGVAELQDGDTPATLFSRADKALYKAKSQGKNQCVKG